MTPEEKAKELYMISSIYVAYKCFAKSLAVAMAQQCKHESSNKEYWEIVIIEIQKIIIEDKPREADYSWLHKDK